MVNYSTLLDMDFVKKCGIVALHQIDRSMTNQKDGSKKTQKGPLTGQDVKKTILEGRVNNYAGANDFSYTDQDQGHTNMTYGMPKPEKDKPKDPET